MMLILITLAMFLLSVVRFPVSWISTNLTQKIDFWINSLTMIVMFGTVRKDYLSYPPVERTPMKK